MIPKTHFDEMCRQIFLRFDQMDQKMDLYHQELVTALDNILNKTKKDDSKSDAYTTSLVD